MTATSEAQATTGPAPQAAKAPTVWSWLSHLSASLAMIGTVFSALWAAYTYSNQYTGQHRQDLLAAFALADGGFGDSTTKKIVAAIEPCYLTKDPQWYILLAARNSALDQAGQDQALRDIQAWLTANLLVKDGKHDDMIHNYRDAMNAIRFLYQYAGSDPCYATALGLKFRQNIYDFFYYFPGRYDFEQSSGTAVGYSPTPLPETRMSDDAWLNRQIDQCSRRLHPLIAGLP